MNQPGIDADGILHWLAEHADVQPPLRFEGIAGGHSNLTYLVSDTSGHRWVLRRPPLHGVLPSAHDMGREHRILHALRKSAVPVPPTVGLCEDAGVTGAPFYVMEYVDGHVLRSKEDAERVLDTTSRHGLSIAVVDTLAALHGIDPDSVGLGDLGRREDYVGRQLRRWHQQVTQGRTRELPLLDEVHQRLREGIPEQQATAIVHGDYRLDNLITSDSGAVLAVLDWELCTLGDPLADVGLMCVYWSDPGSSVHPLESPATLAEGFIDSDQAARLYGEGSACDLDDLAFYIAFGYWKVAAILEGVYSRYVSGAYGQTVDDSWRRFEHLVPELAEIALDMTKHAGR